MRNEPLIPKSIVFSVRVKEYCKLIDVVDDPVAKKKIAKDMQCEMSQVVYRTETGE
jgi:hypothetical protein